MAKKGLVKIFAVVLAVVLFLGVSPINVMASSELADGIYTAPVTLYNSTNTAASMAAGAISDNALIKVENGEATIRVSFQTMTFSGLYGNVTGLYYYNSYEDIAAGNKNATEVVATQTVKSGSTSDYTEIEAPKSVEFVLPSTESADVYLYVEVDAMESMGGQVAILKIDFDNITKGLEDGTYAVEAKLFNSNGVEPYATSIDSATLSIEEGIGTVTLNLLAADYASRTSDEVMELYLYDFHVSDGNGGFVAAEITKEFENGLPEQVTFVIPALVENTAMTLGYSVPEYNNGAGWNHTGISYTLNLDLWSAVLETEEEVVIELPFTDLEENAWYLAAVANVYVNELFDGTGETTFEPETKMTRAMFITVLGRLATQMDITTDGYTQSFIDVEAGSYYEQYVGWAATEGIVDGTGDNYYSPHNDVTREEMAAMFVRFADYAEVELNSDNEVSFTDAADISDWANDSVERAAKAGIINGYDIGEFRPLQNASRAEVAQIFMNYMNLY